MVNLMTSYSENNRMILSYAAMGGFQRTTPTESIKWVRLAAFISARFYADFSTFEEADDEMTEVILGDTDVTVFIKDIFLYELANHEYCITYDLEPILAAFNLSDNDIPNDEKLMNMLNLSKAKYFKSHSEH